MTPASALSPVVLTANSCEFSFPHKGPEVDSVIQQTKAWKWFYDEPGLGQTKAAVNCWPGSAVSVGTFQIY